MSRKELKQWRAYYCIEPFGEEIMNIRFARLSHLIAVAQGVKVDNRTPKVSDFMLKFEKEKEQTPDDHLNILKMWTAAIGAS